MSLSVPPHHPSACPPHPCDHPCPPSTLPTVTPQPAVHFHSHIVHPPICDTPIPMPRRLAPHASCPDLASLGLYLCSTWPLCRLRPRYPSPQSSAPVPPFWFSCILAACCPPIAWLSACATLFVPTVSHQHARPSTMFVSRVPSPCPPHSPVLSRPSYHRPTPASSVLPHGPMGSGHARYVSMCTLVSTMPTSHAQPTSRPGHI